VSMLCPCNIDVMSMLDLYLFIMFYVIQVMSNPCVYVVHVFVSHPWNSNGMYNLLSLCYINDMSMLHLCRILCLCHINGISLLHFGHAYYVYAIFMACESYIYVMFIISMFHYWHIHVTFMFCHVHYVNATLICHANVT
jgi:hypothetical protein